MTIKRTTLALSFLIASLMLAAQEILKPENELHAPAGPPVGFHLPGKQAYQGLAYVNQNLTGEQAPQNEPSVRISRTDPDIIVAAWRDFRLGYLEPDIIRRIGYTYSWDGGETWSESQLLPDPNPDHLSQSDPVVICDMDGNFYISSTSRQPVSQYNREMLLYKSTDSGQTFELHAIAVPGSGLQGEDKEWIFCDPVESNDTYNHLMITWKSFGPDYGIKFRISGPGGADWSETVDVGDSYSGQGANLATGIDGEIFVVWKDDGILFDVSYDQGQSFGSDYVITGYPYEENNSFPFICVDYSNAPSRGNIYVTWADSRNGTGDEVWFQRSHDGGQTWLDDPIRINDAIDFDQFWPCIQVDENGRIVVVYYDERNFPGLINTYLAYSDDEGDTWTNIKVNDDSFYGNMPNSDVRFGDYIGIDIFAGRIIPVWADDRTGDFNQEIYSARIDLTTLTDEFSDRGNDRLYLINYPNPFIGKTNIRFSPGTDGEVRLDLLNQVGQVIETHFPGFPDGDHHTFSVGETLPPGVYFAVVRQKNTVFTSKLIKLEQ